MEDRGRLFQEGSFAEFIAHRNPSGSGSRKFSASIARPTDYNGLVELAEKKGGGFRRNPIERRCHLLESIEIVSGEYSNSCRTGKGVSPWTVDDHEGGRSSEWIACIRSSSKVELELE